MNLRQKLYDSQDSGNVLMKINNSSALYKNLEKIQSRKPIYIKTPINNKIRSNNNQSDYYRREENKIFGKILLGIRDRKVNPNFYTEQNDLININRNSRNKYHQMKSLKIEQENNSFRERVFNQRSIISPRKFDKDYNDLMRKFNNKKKAKNKLILPPIY